MYFISWKTIPQALSTVGKTFLKSLDRYPVNIHHNRSSHLLARRHWFFFPRALFCSPLLFISLLFPFLSTSSHPRSSLKAEASLSRTLSVEIYLQREQKNFCQHISGGEVAPVPWGSLLIHQLMSALHDHTVGKLLVWPFRHLESSSSLFTSLCDLGQVTSVLQPLEAVFLKWQNWANSPQVYALWSL